MICIGEDKVLRDTPLSIPSDLSLLCLREAHILQTPILDLLGIHTLLKYIFHSLVKYIYDEIIISFGLLNKCLLQAVDFLP